MLEQIPADMLTEWMAYFSIEPFGEERGDLRAGVVASTFANVMCSGSQKFQPQDFLLEFGGEPKPPMSLDGMKKTFKAAAIAWNSKRKDD